MATVLKQAEISVDNEVKETVKLQNPCQMWKAVYGWAAKYGDNVRILVTDENDQPFKDLTVKTLKNGKKQLVNAVKETNRAYIKAHKTTETKAQEAAMLEAEIEAEE